MSLGPHTLNRDTVSGEALFILRSLKENGRSGKPVRLTDMKAALEPAVSLEFDAYFEFLQEFEYVHVDRDSLKLTQEGESLVVGDNLDRFSSEVGEFFAEKLLPADESTHSGLLPDDEFDSPPTAIDVRLEESKVSRPPTPPKTGRKNTPEEPVVPSIPPATLNGSRDHEQRREGQPLGGPGAKITELDLRFVKFDAIGAGPLGTAHKGRHNSLGLDVCVKELKDIFGYFSFLQRGEVGKRLKKELCAQAQVRHPNIVTIYDQNTDVARPYFVTELCKGSLRERLESTGGKGLPAQTAIRYFLQMAYALKAAHATGLTHHNLKPENVLIDGFGNVKLADFGMTRVIETDPAKGMPQVFVGTGGLGYMAPELISRAKDSGAAADVYAVGILLYEMLTGQLPGRRSALPSEANTDVPAKLDNIFDKMTQDRRESRYADFEEVLRDFYSAFSDGEYLAKGDLVFWGDAPKL